MKRILLVTVVSGWSLLASAQITTNNFTLSPGVAIPDGNPVGLTETFNVSGVSGSISDIQLSLNIAGGFNGDLYAYLVGPNGGMAILLNRVGVSGSNPAGYGDMGLDITLDDSGADIHNYQTEGPAFSGGQLTGLWAPDGRAIDPGSAGSAFDAAAMTANFGNFLVGDPNGTWTLFIADLSSGGSTANLDNVGFAIMTVPEPSTLALAGLGLAGAMGMRRRQGKTPKTER